MQANCRPAQCCISTASATEIPYRPITKEERRSKNKYGNSRVTCRIRLIHYGCFADSLPILHPSGVANQGRSDEGGISVYIPPPKKKSVNLTNFYVVTGCFFLFDPGQIVVDFEISLT